MKYFLSHYQLRKVYFAWKLGLDHVEVSLDLGKSINRVFFENDNVVFPNNDKYKIAEIYKYSKDLKSIFVFEDNGIYKAEFFSKNNNRFYKLVTMGENDLPNLEISGIRIFNPVFSNMREYIEKRINSHSGYYALVIGLKLGYSSILLSRRFDKVVVLEEDENIIEMMNYNPWSDEFFSSKNISYTICKPYVQVRFFDKEQFDLVFLDPLPFTKDTRQYYSKLLYREIFRTLNSGGILIHTFENLRKGVITNVKTKLKNVGFRKIRFQEDAKCLTAIK